MRIFTNFASRPDMRAAELEHQVQVVMPLHMAQLVIMELGEPAFRNDHWSSWYADAFITDGVDSFQVPFMLRVDIMGNAMAIVPWSARSLWSKAIASLVPEITVEVIAPRRAA